MNKTKFAAATLLSIAICNLAGCYQAYPVYQAPSGSNALLKVSPASSFPNIRRIYIYTDPYTCVVKNRLSEEQLLYSQPATIPANHLFTFTESYRPPGTLGCDFTVSFIPRSNETYVVSITTPKPQLCHFEIFTKTGKPVTFIKRKLSGLPPNFTSCSDTDLVKNTLYPKLKTVE